MNSKELIRNLNPQLFPGETLPTKPYELVLVSHKVVKTDTNGEKVEYETFKHRTKPSEKAQEAGVRKDDYFRCFMNPAGIRKENAEGIVIRSKKKAPPHNIFKRTQTLLYDEIEKIIEEYETASIADKKKMLESKELFIPQGTTQGDFGTGEHKQKKYRLNRVVIPGLQIAMNVPKYAVHRIDANGEIVPLTSTRRDSKGNYKKDQAVYLSVYRFWADEDDLEELEETCARHYENNIKDFETGETITTKRTTHSEETKVASPKIDEAPDPDDQVEE